ncbi:hypothetical protein C3747_71g165 [Trypanosoma cruzi]|uniref:Uncharacterized protein n=2 Tax=Trypanosoma cruzi TaxID=5693 RepID=Q4DVQ9_TRYCC|nr:hypothetical protein, conserved [Trypanosoma cruzi]EAN96593.1 hypothetical protein, conserved [Trypanosoma cruzi]PWV10181.1 hypothetical protein C3747_71g165 [Trypanosoma cruzi]RNC49927.1 hypothetical protein TcCL_NonESM00252 [Trypanosoma cruzi]|eukprot:XP_818444.1 hypothetical protein [Trypanosoma cruzi strain CL Brener]
MTKLVRKLKQMAKKRAHRKTVLKRKVERAQRDIEESERLKKERLELETDLEMHRLNYGEEDAEMKKRLVRLVGNLVLEAPQRKSKKQGSRKQMRRKDKQKERGQAVVAQLEKKWNTKKRRVKQRAQIRNEDLHN